MKFKTFGLIVLLFAVINSAFSQDKEVIRIGLKKEVPNSEIEDLILKDEYNFVDAFEYELAKLLINYAKKSEKYELEIVLVDQSKKLNAITQGQDIDALLYTFSQTPDRIKKGIHFSTPYFQNKAIGVIVNNDELNINQIKDRSIRVGHVSNTTAEKELTNVLLKYKDNLILSAYENHAKLMNALKEKEIDAAAGDVSRLIFDVNEGDFHFGGNLPTKRSKIRDNYCIAMSPSKGHLKPFFDDFIDNSQKEIGFLENKWLSTALEDAYQSYYNKNEDKLKGYIKYISIGAIVLLGLILIIFSNIINRKNKKIKNIQAGKRDEELGRIASLYDAKGRASIESSHIAQIGCDFFKTAKKIIYVGSGGFLSDPNKEIREAWTKSLHEFLGNPNNIFQRVIDLPKMETNEDNEAQFSSPDNFNPDKLDPDYMSRYIKWLFIQYSNLLYHDNIQIMDSRGAALWGYGIVIMIKDEKEVLIFTTNRDTKIGSCIRDEKLAKRIAEIIYGVTKIGIRADAKYIKEKFLTNDPRLNELTKEIDKLNSKTLPEDLMRKIDDYCKHIEK